MHRRTEYNLYIQNVDPALRHALSKALEDYFADDTNPEDVPWIGIIGGVGVVDLSVTGKLNLPGDWQAFTTALFDRVAAITPARCRMELWDVIREPDAVFTNYPLDITSVADVVV
jgi:hypothetical protein